MARGRLVIDFPRTPGNLNILDCRAQLDHGSGPFWLSIFHYLPPLPILEITGLPMGHGVSTGAIVVTSVDASSISSDQHDSTVS